MTKIPQIIQRIFFNQVWSIPNSNNKIYLTFDDGPIPFVTEEILKILEQHKIKATFFCIGDNIKKHPDVFKKIINEEHALGNHTFHHLKGWKTPTKSYIENVKLCETELEKSKNSILNTKHPKLNTQNSKIFRPPYGRISLWQSYNLRKLGYKVIMWDVLSKDYNNRINPERCYKNVVNNVKSGSIIVFHDSLKAQKNVLNCLEKTIITLKEKGFVFEKLS